MFCVNISSNPASSEIFVGVQCVKKGNQARIDCEMPLDAIRRFVETKTFRLHTRIAGILYRLRVDDDQQDLLPLSLVKSWHAKDPNSLRMLKNESDDIVAFFNLLFVKKQIFSHFIDGEIFEKDILSKHILSPKDSQKEGEDYIYISLVLTKSPGRVHALAYILLYLAKYLDLLRNHRKINKVYALLASEDFGELLASTGFSIKTPNDKRKDEHDLFVADTSQINSFFNYLKQRKRRYREVAEDIQSKEERWKPIF